MTRKRSDRDIKIKQSAWGPEITAVSEQLRTSKSCRETINVLELLQANGDPKLYPLALRAIDKLEAQKCIVPTQKCGGFMQMKKVSETQVKSCLDGIPSQSMPSSPDTQIWDDVL